MKRCFFDSRCSGMTSGRGDYAVNSIVHSDSATDIVPKFAVDSNSVTISNVEYVKDIYAPGSVIPFSVQTLALNPGLPVAFPWLSQIAANYQEYELMQCIYTYKTTVADFASSSGQVGQVVMATQYNPSLGPFADKETMMMYDGSASCKTSMSMLHGVECDPFKLAATTGRKYVRTGSVPSTEDLKEYDQGVLNIAVLNPPVTYLGQVLGELWVSYTVRLKKPKLSALNGNNILTDLFAYYNQIGTVVPSSAMGQNSQLQLQASRNSFGGTLTAVNKAFTSGQPPAAYVQGVPNLGSTLDPLDIFADEAYSALYTGAPWPPASWVTGPSPATNVFIAGYCYTFPDNFQGVATVVFSMFGRPGGGPADIETTTFVQPLAAGNVFRFKDIPERTGTLSPYDIRYSHCVRIANDNNNAAAPTDSNWNGITCTCHVRCQPATNGVPNRLYFGQLSTVLLATSWIPVITEVYASVYNATLSQSLSGKADRLQLEFTDTQLPYTTI